MSSTEPTRLTRAGLITSYDDYAKPRSAWRVGAELERHLLRPDGSVVPYFGEHGVAWILDRLAVQGGWKRYHEGDHLIALERHGAWITLEPGSQLELSGAPHHSLDAVRHEAESFDQDLTEVIGDAPILPITTGYTPFAEVEQIPWVPKQRYVIMREHLGHTGNLAHHMMKGTAATQATFDFGSEADAAYKVGIATKLGPLTTAIFANSPLRLGKPTGYMSFRGNIWTHTDPARTGFPEAATGFTFERWVDYLLDVPMMFTCHNGHWAAAHGRSFRSWMEQGIDGTYPDDHDWELHLTSVFPEVRVKRGIEVRGADCVPHDLSIALVALLKGLLDGVNNHTDAEALAADFFALGTKEERFEVACRSGLEGAVGGRTLAAWASDLLDLADVGLRDVEPRSRPLLQPLRELVASGKSPGAALLSDPSILGVAFHT